MGLIMKKGNVTLKSVQWMVVLHPTPTSLLVARPVEVESSRACDPAPTLNHVMVGRTVLETTKRHASAIHSLAQLMEAMMNGETILNVLQLVVLEIRCGCVLAPIRYHSMEESLVWAHILSPENAIHSPAQVMVGILNGQSFLHVV